ncbi:hypothetical protein ACFX2F_017207 [Malus domestica]
MSLHPSQNISDTHSLSLSERLQLSPFPHHKTLLKVFTLAFGYGRFQICDIFPIIFSQVLKLFPSYYRPQVTNIA